jgi:hypothetical protein
MRFGERTQADYFTNFPNSSEQSRIQPYYVNDLSQSKQSSFPSKYPHHHHTRSHTNTHTLQSKQSLQDKYNKVQLKYQQLCKQNQQLKAKTLRFQNALNTYNASPLSAQSKRFKLQCNTNPSSLSQPKTTLTDYQTKDIIDKMAKAEFYGDIGTPHDIYNTIKDKVLERSLYLYPNKNCHTCAQFFSVGLSSHKCPKCHHLQII